MFVKDYQRVIYGKNPLVQVSCHFRFPSLLKIETEVPADFQELIKKTYPLYGKTVQSEVSERLATSLPSEFLSRISNTTHNFESEDHAWTVQLTSRALTITTDTYSTWQDFKHHFRNPYESFLKVYEPRFFAYVGLRYQDVISRKELNFAPDTPWSHLIQPFLLGIVGEVAESRVHANDTQLVVELEDMNGFIGVNHGLDETEEDGSERVYTIDHTFFTHDRTEIGNAETILDGFNKKAGAFFRWCITETLHNAMEPKSSDSRAG